ncbi:MAG: hypothetical protein ABIU09_09740 [Pyrinomonadaceae bacterium]
MQVPAKGPGEKLATADFSIRYIDQDAGQPEVLEARLASEFADASEVADLPENFEVTRAAQLMMNARARLEAMSRMDHHDRQGAMDILMSVTSPTRALFSNTDSSVVRAELERELNELLRQTDKINNADDDIMSRKNIAYARHSRRTGK